MVHVDVEEILPGHLLLWLSDALTTEASPSIRHFLLEEGIPLDDPGNDLFIQALKKAGNNKVVAAKLLNISYDSFR